MLISSQEENLHLKGKWMSAHGMCPQKGVWLVQGRLFKRGGGGEEVTTKIMEARPMYFGTSMKLK